MVDPGFQGMVAKAEGNEGSRSITQEEVPQRTAETSAAAGMGFVSYPLTLRDHQSRRCQMNLIVHFEVRRAPVSESSWNIALLCPSDNGRIAASR
jgi:hypothetical protein